MQSSSLQGRVAVVTGASKGLGKQMAESLAAAGASVALIARNEPLLQSVAAGIRNAGGSDSGSFQWTPSFPTAGAAPAQVIANVPANGQVLITQGLPNGCYTPGFSGVCQFSISLDDHDEVEEWSEANTFESHCVSPAG